MSFASLALALGCVVPGASEAAAIIESTQGPPFSIAVRSATLTTSNRDEAQTAALEQFRQELLAEGLIPADHAEKTAKLGYDRFDDQTLLRFLRARKFDLPRAKAMWAANEKWRDEFGADAIAA